MLPQPTESADHPRPAAGVPGVLALGESPVGPLTVQSHRLENEPRETAEGFAAALADGDGLEIAHGRDRRAVKIHVAKELSFVEINRPADLRVIELHRAAEARLAENRVIGYANLIEMRIADNDGLAEIEHADAGAVEVHVVKPRPAGVNAAIYPGPAKFATPTHACRRQADGSGRARLAKVEAAERRVR